MIKMNIREVSQKLSTGVGIKLEKYGFIYLKKDKTFRREFEGFIQIFDLLYTKKPEGIYVEPTIRLKSKNIEDTYHRVTKKESKYFDGTKTLGNNLFKIIKYYEEGIEKDTDEKQRYIIEEEGDLDILINVISEKFITYGLRYFEENSTIARVDHLLNKYPREISIHNWLYPLRACIAIIAAKINRNPQYEELRLIYREEMEEAVEPYNKEFEELITRVLL